MISAENREDKQQAGDVHDMFQSGTQRGDGLTFWVGAGLCEALAVREHGNPRHRHTKHAAVFTRFILRRKKHQQSLVAVHLKKKSHSFS